MSRFICTYWTGATQTFDTMTMADAINLSGYSDEANLINGIHVWVITPDVYVEVTNSDGEIVAKIERQYDIDVVVIEKNDSFAIMDGFSYDGTMTQDVAISDIDSVEGIIARCRENARTSGAWAESMMCGPIRITRYNGEILGWLFFDAMGRTISRKGDDIPMGTAYFRNYADNPFLTQTMPNHR